MAACRWRLKPFSYREDKPAQAASEELKDVAINLMRDGLWMMKIEKLDVSEECREKLISSGFRDVDEIVQFLLNVPGKATFTFPWIDYFEEVVHQLKVLRLLPEDHF